MKQRKIFCWNSKHFSIIWRMLAIWSRVPRPFMKPACSAGSSHSIWVLRCSFIMCNKILLACGIKAMVRWFLELERQILPIFWPDSWFPNTFAQLLQDNNYRIVSCFKSSPGMSSIPGASWFFNFLMASWTSDRRISGSSPPQGGNSSGVSLVSSWDAYRFS